MADILVCSNPFSIFLNTFSTIYFQLYYHYNSIFFTFNQGHREKGAGKGRETTKKATKYNIERRVCNQ